MRAKKKAPEPAKKICVRCKKKTRLTFGPKEDHCIRCYIYNFKS